ncbi:MFS transporter [Sphingomonas sp.]|jgi:MFS family permease|uniref:MFS transporter n=1 Tax=Sphingomonas sp. TaxID=28214 RepID=UPI002DF01AAB|nr:MFS transporter [Sphingomonas sp.]HEV2567171.1 MFS transporter [Sphingomonas sp.]
MEQVILERAWLTLALVVASTIIGLMGTDLVLPAVPQLPEKLGTTAPSAQLVLAAYVGGTCIGLLAFGSLSKRFATGRLFIGSLVATSLLSLACGLARSIEGLIALRALQGAAAAGPAVFAPALVKSLSTKHVRFAPWACSAASSPSPPRSRRSWAPAC